MSDLDFTAMDIGDEQAWDTDLEPDGAFMLVCVVVWCGVGGLVCFA